MTSTKLLASLGIDPQDPVMAEGRFVHLMEIHLPRALELATTKPGAGNEGALLVIVNNVLEQLHRSQNRQNQYKILQYLVTELRRRGRENPALGVVLQHVQNMVKRFGEAQVAGPAAIISMHRLRDEYYGLPPNPALLVERLTKELLHELGHTQGLRHCGDWRCVMSSAHTVERIDVRQAAFCRDCARLLAARPRD